MARHPDRGFAEYVLDGIQQGFRVGFDYKRHHCRPAKKNMRSATQFPQVISKYLDAECKLGRVVALEDSEASQSIQTSPFGVIPKKGKPDQ